MYSTLSQSCPNYFNYAIRSLAYIYGLYLALIALILVGS